jgi:hypothetical protein
LWQPLQNSEEGATPAEIGVDTASSTSKLSKENFLDSLDEGKSSFPMSGQKQVGLRFLIVLLGMAPGVFLVEKVKGLNKQTPL